MGAHSTRVALPLRAAAGLVAGAALLPLTAALAAPVAASEAFVAGTGTSSASIARLTLNSSGLAVGVGLGQARTRFAGAQGNAEAESVDLGLLATLSKAPIACGVAPGSLFPEGSMPAGVAVSSGGGADEARSASVGAGSPIELGSQFGSASPNSKADAAVQGARIDLAGIVTALGGNASSAAELIPGSQRAASAASSLSSLSLGGGLVVLEGLRWSASHRTGAESESESAFSVAAMTIAGQQVPSTGADDLRTAMEQANAVLAAVGLELTAPTVSASDTGAAVGPLRLSVFATPELRLLLAPALEAIQPMRSQLLEFLTPFSASPDCGLAKALGFGYLIADLALVALGDNGGVDVDFGGARAGTEFATFVDPFAGSFGLIVPSAVVPGVGAPGVSAPGRTPPAPAGQVPATVFVAPQPDSQLSPVSLSCRSTHSDGDGCAARHGELAAWIVLLLVVVLAAADRWRSSRT
ncbi:MAG: hypothetical protein ACT4PP_12350 [Sporichthyaceae bacterium]